MSDVLLRLQDVSVAFGGPSGWTQVTDAVNLEVAANEFVGLVGESGSGKSVTCMSAIGLVHTIGGTVVRGRVELGGHDTTEWTARQWRAARPSEIAMIFQQPRASLNPAFTVGDQIAEVLRVHQGAGRREAWRRAVTLMSDVRIVNAEQRARDYPHQLSGGMCQRIMIAIALACDPAILIADEPTTALDVTVQREILDLLRVVQHERGLGVLYVSHDLSVIEDVCDRVAVMYAGQVVEQAGRAELFARPQHPYTAGLIASTPTLERGRDLGMIRGQVPAPTDYSSACRFVPRCDFMQEGRCDVPPVQLRAFANERLVRCVRAEELALTETVTS